MVDRELLRDGRAERQTCDVRALDAYRVEQRGRIVGEHAHRVRLRIGRVVARPRAPVVERDHAVALGENLGRRVPEGVVGSGAHDQEHGLAGAALLVVERHSGGQSDARHRQAPLGSGATSSASQTMIETPPVAKFGTSANASAISGDASARSSASSSSK